MRDEDIKRWNHSLYKQTIQLGDWIFEKFDQPKNEPILIKHNRLLNLLSPLLKYYIKM